MQLTLNAMESESDREKIEKEIQRKIGRNLLMYQQVEHMLKFLIAHGNVSGSLSDIKKVRSETFSSRTLGQLVNPFLEDTFSDSKVNEEQTNNITEPYITFSFKVETDAVYYEERRQSLASIVTDRNELVHHLLPRLDLSSIDNMLDIGQYLDSQREKLIPEINILKELVTTLSDGRKQMGEYLLSDEGKKEWELGWLRQERVVILLGDIASQMARPDGWTLLNTAGEILRQHAPEELASIYKRYKHKTLKKLILATEIFNLFEEPTDKGGFRVLYRLKEGWSLSSGVPE